MSSDQCALNADGSFKDTNNIQSFNDKDNDEPLQSSATIAQPLGRGFCNKTANRFSDTVACERLNSDEELGPLSEPPKRKCATRTSKVSARVATPLSSSNSFDTLAIKQSSGEEDGSFGADSSDKSGISNTEVWVIHMRS
jgi:hypothetical protein